MLKKRIMFVDADFTMSQKMQSTLRNESTHIHCVLSMDEAMDFLSKHTYGLLIINFNMLGNDYVQLLRALRSIRAVPILILTKMSTTPDRIALLQAGASVCMEAGDDLSECIAQAQALIELCESISSETNGCRILAFGNDLIIDPSRWQVKVNGEPVMLTHKEFALLYCLASKSGLVMTHEQIYHQVWKNESDINLEGTIKSHISTLRQKLGTVGQEYIKNVRNVGYQFKTKNN